MTEREEYFVRTVRTMAGRRSGQKLVKHLSSCNLGFEVVGEGCYKTALSHRVWPEFVVKVYNLRGSWYYDEVMVAPVPKILKPYWMPFLFVCRRFVIQHRAKACNEKTSRFFRDRFSGEYDLGEWNVGLYKGEPRIFDYGLPHEDQMRLPKFRVLHYN